MLHFRPALKFLIAIASASAFLLAQTPSQDPSQKATIEGKVVSAAGAPLAKVSVTLRPINTGAAPVVAGAPAVSNVFTSVTGLDGEFRFDDLDAGRYNLSANRAGFVNQNYGAKSPGRGGTPLTLAPAEHLKGRVISMTPQGLIGGKIMDEDGDPVNQAQIVVYRLAFVNGKRQLQPFGFANLNPDSTFMVGNLAPGRYYISASAGPQFDMNPSQRTVARGPQQGALPTFYPSAADYTSATPVEIGPGADVRGIDIRMRRSSVFEIKGRVTGLPAADPSKPGTIQPSLRLTSRSVELLDNNRITAVNVRDGTFVFRNVPPGDYTIQSNGIFQEAAGPSRLVALVPVSVADHNVEGVEVALNAGTGVTGTMQLAGAESLPAGVIVNFTPVNASPFGGFGRAQVEKNGAFHADGLMPARYRIAVANLPQGSFVKAIRANNQDVAADNLDLTNGSPGPVEIVLSPEAAELTGTARNEKNDIVASAVVVLWKASSTRSEDVHQATADQNGSFTIRNLPPGEYRAAAWEELEFGLAQSADFLARFESSAAKVSFTPSGRMAQDLKIIDAETTEKEIAKLP